MVRCSRRALFPGLLGLLLLVPRHSAAAEWHEDYVAGVKAVEAGRWQEGVRLLEAARAREPKASAQKRIYGVRFIDYVPQYYLGLAYLGLNNREKALEYLEQAESDGEVLKKHAEAFQRALEKARAGTPTPAAAAAPAAPVAPPIAVTPPARPPGESAAYAAAVAEAKAAADARRPDDAVRRLEQARRLDPPAFERQGLERRREELAEQGRRGRRMLAEAQKEADSGRLRDARRKLDEAEQVLAGETSAATLDEELVRRTAEYARRKAEAETAARRGGVEAAVKAYEKAQVADPQTFDVERLGQRVSELRTTAPAAKPASAGASPVPTAPLPLERGAAAGRARADLADALRRLFAGQTREGAARLEALARASPEDPEVHGYLAVALAKEALLAAEPEARERLRRAARAALRSARRVRPDFALPERLVSPAVRDLLTEAGSGS